MRASDTFPEGPGFKFQAGHIFLQLSSLKGPLRVRISNMGAGTSRVNLKSSLLARRERHRIVRLFLLYLEADTVELLSTSSLLFVSLVFDLFLCFPHASSK